MNIKLILLPMIICQFVLYSCDNKRTTTNISKPEVPLSPKKFTSLNGTWIAHNKEGFSIIEIVDSGNVTFISFCDRKALIDTIQSDRYWYYNSKAKIGFWDTTTIWIKTSKYRFDYLVKDDTLVEFDKMGEQRRFIKVHNDE